LSASLLSPAVHAWLGSDRRALTLGLAGITLYAVAALSPIRWVHLFGASAAGVGGALLWNAEGVYLSKLALIDAACAPPRNLRESTSQLAAIFATLLPAALTIGKLIASAVLIPFGDTRESARALFVIYAAAGALAAACMHAFLREPHPSAAVAGTPRDRRAACALTLSRARDTLAANATVEMLLLAPTNVAFGLATGNVPSHGGRLVAHVMGAGHVGWLFALAGLVAACAASAHARLASPFGRALSTLSGAAAFTAAGLLCAWLAPLAGQAPSRALVPPIVALFLLYGYGMAVWQGTTMAVFAERFASDPAVGFANLKLHSGLASSFAFYAFQRMGPIVAGRICAGWAVAGGVCYLLLPPARPLSLHAAHAVVGLAHVDVELVATAADAGQVAAPVVEAIDSAPADDGENAASSLARKGRGENGHALGRQPSASGLIPSSLPRSED
jgi:hypothetical protein